MTGLDELRALVQRGNVRDRAFVDGVVRMSRARREELRALHDDLRAVALRSHDAIRCDIAARTLRGTALRKLFDDVPAGERDHFVEEVLGIAYPPLDEPDLGPDVVADVPSGYDEILHAFDVTGLGPGDRFLDIGSGTGKVVMLAELLGDATTAGIEKEPALIDVAASAARALGLRARFDLADARDAAIADADVLFMYLPFTGHSLATVMTRLTERRRGRHLCCGALDLRRYDQLVAVGPPRSWLHVYAWR